MTDWFTLNQEPEVPEGAPEVPAELMGKLDALLEGLKAACPGVQLRERQSDHVVLEIGAADHLKLATLFGEDGPVHREHGVYAVFSYRNDSDR